jgi:hypothetical protein
MSCTSADNCTAGGCCADASGQQAFLGSEVNDADPSETLDAFDRECAASRQAVAQAPSLDVLSKQPSKRTGQPWSLRWIVTHMIEERELPVRCDVAGRQPPPWDTGGHLTGRQFGVPNNRRSPDF